MNKEKLTEKKNAVKIIVKPHKIEEMRCGCLATPVPCSKPAGRFE